VKAEEVILTTNFCDHVYFTANRELWQLSGQTDINMEKTKRKFRWIDHTLRKDNEKPSKVALQWNPQGNRGMGRPGNSWWRSTLRETGRSWSELRWIGTNGKIL
jgi:hypothetical protein